MYKQNMAKRIFAGLLSAALLLTVLPTAPAAAQSDAECICTPQEGIHADTCPLYVPAETEPVVTEPAVTEPEVTEPVETEPVETDPVVTEPDETEPVETTPAAEETPEESSGFNGGLIAILAAVIAAVCAVFVTLKNRKK